LVSIVFWPFRLQLHIPAIIKNAGLVLLIGGGVFLFFAVRTLKSNFRPSLKPSLKGGLIIDGLYSVVRHPAYGAIVISLFGLSVWLDDGARMALSVCLLLFFGVKANTEEQWLEKKYPEYREYKKRVPKRFIPWVF